MLRSQEPYVRVLSRELAKPRTIPLNAVQFFKDRYFIEETDVAEFLQDRIEKGSNFDINKILTPIYTPTVSDCAIYTNQIEDYPLSKTEAGIIPNVLFELKLAGKLVLGSTNEEIPFLFPRVTMSHHVELLRLNELLTHDMHLKIDSFVPEEDRHVIKTIMRCALTLQKEANELFLGYLHALKDLQLYSLERVVQFTSVLNNQRSFNLPTLEKKLRKKYHKEDEDIFLNPKFSRQLPERIIVVGSTPWGDEESMRILTESVAYMKTQLPYEIRANLRLLQKTKPKKDDAGNTDSTI